jgi:hypothetical protein
MSKWLKIFTVDYYGDIIATIIFVEFMMHFWYMHLASK